MPYRGYKYSPNSLRKIQTTVPELQELCEKAIHIANTRKMFCPDFGISRGYSSAEEQFELYKKGRQLLDGKWVKTGTIVTNCDGAIHLSKHQSKKAIDFYAYVNKRADYTNANISYIVTCFFEAATDMRINIDWGGSFKSISDGAHIELVS
jgi:hypothetical protein